jgi:serine kinase of HPr protein (carbohydrate metabolism regulator)
MSEETPSVLVHATSVVLGAAVRPFGGPEEFAVLLFGDSRSGKSDVALRLIAAGGLLISDDQTSLSTDENFLFAHSVANISGQIEIRGIGIIKLDRAPKAPVALAVKLDPKAAPERLPEPSHYVPPAPLTASYRPPLVTLHPFEPSAPAKIAAAAAAAVSDAFVAGVAPPKTS